MQKPIYLKRIDAFKLIFNLKEIKVDNMKVLKHKYSNQLINWTTIDHIIKAWLVIVQFIHYFMHSSKPTLGSYFLHANIDGWVRMRAYGWCCREWIENKKRCDRRLRMVGLSSGKREGEGESKRKEIKHLLWSVCEWWKFRAIQWNAKLNYICWNKRKRENRRCKRRRKSQISSHITVL